MNTTTTTTTAPLTTIHSSHGLPNKSGAADPSQSQTQPQRKGFSDANALSIRPVNSSGVQEAYTSIQPQAHPRSKHPAIPSDVQGAYASCVSPVSPIEPEPEPKYSSNGYGKQSRQAKYDGATSANSASIHRKEVGASPTSPSDQSSAPSHPQKGHNRGKGVDETVSSASTTLNDGYTPRRLEPAPAPAPALASAPASSSILDRNRPISKGQSTVDARAVVDKAKTNTKDTSIVEKYAPGKLSEPWKVTIMS